MTVGIVVFFVAYEYIIMTKKKHHINSFEKRALSNGT